MTSTSQPTPEDLSRLARYLGTLRSAKKAKASRLNGKKGGRPKNDRK